MRVSHEALYVTPEGVLVRITAVTERVGQGMESVTFEGRGRHVIQVAEGETERASAHLAGYLEGCRVATFADARAATR